MRHLATLMLIVGLCCSVSVAQEVPDFQTILQGLPAKFQTATKGFWELYGVYQSVSKDGVFFMGSNSLTDTQHIYANGMREDFHLLMLQKVLDNDPCTRDLLGAAFVDGVRAQFFANRALVQTLEAYTDVELIKAGTRLDVKYGGLLDVKNRPAYTNRFRLYTGRHKNDPDPTRIKVTIETGHLVVGTTSLEENVTIPSLWGGDDGLMHSGAPYIDQDLASLLAAYLTIGDQNNVDFIQGVIFEMFYGGVLPNILDLIFDVLLKDWDFGDAEPWEPVDDKAFTHPGGTVANINIQEALNKTIEDGDLKIKIISAQAIIYGDSLQAGFLNGWLNKYTVGANGFGAGFASRLAAAGDLDGDGLSNAFAAQTNSTLQDFFDAVGFNPRLTMTSMPMSPGTLNYGQPLSLACNTTSHGPLAYQWYSGPAANNMQAISGATARTFNTTVDYYSWGEIEQSRFFKVIAQVAACGQTLTEESSVVEVPGGAPPAISILAQPTGGDFNTGDNHTMQVTANVGTGNLSYQWQIKSGENWNNISGANTNKLVFTGLSAADTGTYRCRVFNNLPQNKSGEKANPEYYVDSDPVTLSIKPTIVFDVQPDGASLIIGDDYTIYASASVTEGNLEYRWYKNSGTGYQALGPWVDAGDISFATQLDITNAVVGDSGRYRVTVRNTLPVIGTYTANSAEALIGVTTGITYFVDPTGDDSDGLSWATAFNTLQPGIDAASSAGGGEVWVAGGLPSNPVVYNEERTEIWGDLSVIGSLVMKNNVALLGGFEGYRDGDGAQENTSLLRNRALNVAVIDGSVANSGGPAYHVVVFGSENDATVNASIDGFVITGGVAAGVPGDYHTNRGGGVYVWGSAPTIANCVIHSNFANVGGGGIANISSGTRKANTAITNCLFYDNVADRQADGIPGPDGGSPLRGGGAIFNDEASPTMSFLTIVGNTVDNSYDPPDGDFGPNSYGVDSGAIFTWRGSPTLTNSIIWGNTGAIAEGQAAGDMEATIVSYSIVEGGFAGPGNQNVDPELGNADYAALGAFANYVPDVDSPAIDAGDPAVTGGDDLLGVVRPLPDGGSIDMGAFEVSLNGPIVACVDADGIDLNTITSNEAFDPFEYFDFDASDFEVPFWKVELEYQEFDCADMPATTMTLVGYDILGRTNTCDVNIAVTETVKPVLVTNDISVELDANGVYELDADDILALAAGSSDNCTETENLSIEVSPSDFECLDVGQNVIVLVKVTDELGNFAQDTAVVTVLDNLPPVVPAVATLDVDLNAGDGEYSLSEAEINALLAGVTDNCAVNLNATVISQVDFSCADIGENEIDITFFDVSGNSAATTAIVNVNDVTKPVLYGVTSRSFNLGTGDFTEAVALQSLVATDVCDGDLSGAIVAEVFDQDDNLVPFPVSTDWELEEGQSSYVFTLVYTVTDSSGNVETVSTTLTFDGVKLPEITILGTNPVYHECHTVYYYDEDEGATVWDPQGESDITYLMTTTFIIDDQVPGTYEVVYSIGVPGYPSIPPVTASRTFIVEDTIDPTITLLGSTQLISPLGEAYSEPGFNATDSCAGNLNADVVVSGLVDVDVPGEYTLAYDVADPAGNAAVTQYRTVVVAEEVTITRSPSGARKYTTDEPFDLEANYTGGFDLDGHEWFRDGVGLGMAAPETGGNTVALTIDPATHDLGVFNYSLQVSDYGFFKYNSDVATVEIGKPLSVVSSLPDLAVQAGEEAEWAIEVTGGLGATNYQWYMSVGGGKSFTPVEDGPFGDGAFAGADTNTLSLVPFSPDMVGLYQVEVSDDFTSITVGPANLILDYGIPAAGAIGIAMLALATALGGARALRKRD